MLTEEVRRDLFKLQDTEYRDLLRRLIPTVLPEAIIGVRTPELRKYGRELRKRTDAGVFLRDLPHGYFDENQLHAFIISETKDFNDCVGEVCAFLPYIDNWATCDQLCPKVFGRHRDELLPFVKQWISSGLTYSVRFAIGMLMRFFLDGDFDVSYPEAVLAVRTDEYYVNMMRAWYFATALAKRYEEIIPVICERRLDPWTHNMTIKKAAESYRITDERKEFLKSLKVPAGCRTADGRIQ